MQSEKLKDPVLPALIVIVLVAAAAGAYYYWFKHEQEPWKPLTAPVAEAPPPPEAKPEPPIRYPIERTEPEAAKPLPPIAESDEPIKDAAARLGGKEFERYFYLDNIVRRVVVTIDNLPRKKLSQRYNLTKPVAGKLSTSGKDEEVTLNPNNYRRYTPYVRLAENIDTTKLVSLYIYFYPLFQEEYENLGYPKKYFNDRLVEVIDDLLATPDVKQPVRLVQPKVYYEFADPSLESLSAGQKTLIRMGPENAARVKAKLQEIRSVLLRAR